MEELKLDYAELAKRIAQEISRDVESALESAVEAAVACAVGDAVQDALEGFALQDRLADTEFVLKDGTVVRPVKRLMVLSNDKTKYISCYGGLEVYGKILRIQTRNNSWDSFHYPTKEEAKENLLKIKKAMDEGLESIEL